MCGHAFAEFVREAREDGGILREQPGEDVVQGEVRTGRSRGEFGEHGRLLLRRQLCSPHAKLGFRLWFVPGGGGVKQSLHCHGKHGGIGGLRCAVFTVEFHTADACGDGAAQHVQALLRTLC